MIRALILASLCALCVTAQPVSAQVFKCKGPSGKVEYQSTPCTGDATQRSVELMNDAPSREDALRAQQRALSNKRQAAAIDAERERSQQRAMAAQDKRYEEKAAKEKRCAEYQASSERLDDRSSTWYTKKYQDDDRAEAKALRDKHFSECFAR